MPDLTLTEEEKMLQNLVRDFAEREGAPLVFLPATLSGRRP